MGKREDWTGLVFVDWCDVILCEGREGRERGIGGWSFFGWLVWLLGHFCSVGLWRGGRISSCVVGVVCVLRLYVGEGDFHSREAPEVVVVAGWVYYLLLGDLSCSPLLFWGEDGMVCSCSSSAGVQWHFY